MNKEDQIAVLKKAKAELIREYRIQHTHRGLCYYISYQLASLIETHNRNDYLNIPIYIPLFSRENAKRFASEEENFMCTYWFFAGNSKSRIKFINWMIKELKKGNV